MRTLSNRVHLIYFFSVSLILLPCAVLAMFVVLYSQNSLFLNNNWYVQKRIVQMALIGGDEFLLTRIPLAQNILNLGSYFGFQEIILRDKLNPKEIQFYFKIEEDSYLDLTYNRNGSQYAGLRLSSSGDFSSISFTSTTEGRFLFSAAIPPPTLSPGWHKVSIKNSEVGLLLVIDEKAHLIPTAAQFSSGSIGFRSGMRGAKIDNIAIQTSQGNWVRHFFHNTKNWLSILTLNFALLVLAGTIFSRIIRHKGRNALFPWILISFTGISCLGSWYVFDFFYYSQIIHSKTGITRPLFPDEHSSPLTLEELRYKTFNLWYRLSGGEEISRKAVIEKGYPANRIYKGPVYCGVSNDRCFAGSLPDTLESQAVKKLAYRIIFIGTSQTIGVGANRLEDTFYVRTHLYLRAGIPASIHLESINISVSGSNSKSLLKDYEQDYLKLRPDIVLINLANNDKWNKKFFPEISSILKKNKLSGIKTVLLEEASGQGDSSHRFALLTNHKELRKLAQLYNIPVYPLHEYLNQPSLSSSGTVWWDHVHLTSYGHELVAHWLAPKLLKELQSSPPTRRTLLKVKELLKVPNEYF